MKLLTLFIILFSTFTLTAQTEPENQILPLNPIERPIKPAEIHEFRFTSGKNQFVRFDVEQTNADPQLTITDKDGKELHKVYFEKMIGKTAISFISDEKQNYTLIVQSSGRSKMTGSYRMTMTVPRPVEAIDSERIVAEKILTGGGLMPFTDQTRSEKPSDEQRLKMFEQLKNLTEQWKKFVEPNFEQATWHKMGLIAKNMRNAEKQKLSFEMALDLARRNKDILGETWALYYLGDLEENTGRYKEAEQNYTEAINLVSKTLAKTVIAEIKYRFAVFYQNRSKHEISRKLLTETIEIYGELQDEVNEMRMRAALGLVMNEIDGKTDLTAIYQKALEIYKKNNSYYFQGQTLRVLGNEAADAGKFNEAEKYYKESLAIAEKYGEPTDEAGILLRIGLIKFLQANSAAARQNFENALLKLNNNLNSTIGIRLLEAVSRIDFSEGKITEGLSKIMRASEIAGKIGTIKDQIEINSFLSVLYITIGKTTEALEIAKLTKKLADDSGNKSFQALGANALGRVHHFQGNYPEALDLFSQTIQLGEESRQMRVAALGYQTLGSVYYELGDFDRAEKNIFKAIEILQNKGSALDKLLSNAALAQIYLRRKKLAQAKELLNNSLILAQTSKNGFIESQLSLFLGILAFDEKNFSEAAKKFQETIGIASKSKAAAIIVMTLTYLGDSLTELGKFSESQAVHGQSLSLYKQFGSIVGEATAFNSLMKLELKKGNKRQAIFYGKQSVNLLQKVRGSIQPLDIEIRKTFLSSIEAIYRNLAGVLLDENRISEAQQVLSLLKEEEFFQFVRRSPEAAENKAGRIFMTPGETQLSQNYADISEKTLVIATRLSQLQLGQNEQMPATDRQSELQKLQIELAALNGVYIKYLADVTAQFNLSPKDEVVEFSDPQIHIWQNELSNDEKNSALLTTLITENRYYVIITTPKSQTVRSQEINQSDLSSKIQRLRDVLNEPRSNVLPAAKEIYDILIKPLEKDFDDLKLKNLMWSLDDDLRYIPISVLHDGEKFMIESFTNVVVTFARPPTTAAKSPRNWRALGGGVSEKIGEFDALPYVYEELSSVVRDETTKKGRKTGLFSGRILLNRQFNRSNLSNAFKQSYQLVHLATHFVLNSGKDTDSYLLLGDGSKLNLAEIRSTDILNFNNIELLTLSACETGVGEEDANGAEIESFAVIAQQRGARTVLATLWATPDDSIPRLMTEFYSIYKNGDGLVSKAEALRQAQLRIINDRSSSHPTHWGSFIILGDWR